MFALIAIILAAPPADLDPVISRADRSPRVVEAAVSEAPSVPGWSTPPLVTSEGLTARLLSQDDLARVQAIDAKLEEHHFFSRILLGIGGLAASVPIGFCGYMAVTLVVESLKLSAALVLFSPFLFTIGFVGSLFIMPPPILAVAGVGLAFLTTGGLLMRAEKLERENLLKERRAILAKVAPETSALPAVAPLSTVVTF